MHLLLYRLKISWAILSGLMVLLALFGPLLIGEEPFFGAVVGFFVAAGIPFMSRLSVIARLCLVVAVLGSCILYGDPHRWPYGLFLSIGLPLVLFFTLKAVVRSITRILPSRWTRSEKNDAGSHLARQVKQPGQTNQAPAQRGDMDEEAQHT